MKKKRRIKKKKVNQGTSVKVANDIPTRFQRMIHSGYRKILVDTDTHVNVFPGYPANGYVTGIPYTQRSGHVPGRPAQRKSESGNY